ncbi:MAG TPA: hypothetical protein PLA10_06555, partial [Clostridiales bacterium]|nr:hypothetical protein [Clostridiales bacterium]
RNITIIRLAVQFVIGNLDNVYSDPVNYPQFNIGRYSKAITNSLLPMAYKVLAEPDGLSADVLAELEAAVLNAEQAIEQTNAYTAPNTEKAQERLEKALVAAGALKPSKQNDTANGLITALLKLANDAIMQYYGARGFSDHKPF